MKSPAKYARYLRAHIRQNKKTRLVYSVLRILVILTLVRQIIIHNWEGAGVCALSLVLFLAPSFMEDNFKIVIPPVFEATIYVFIYAAEILGEVNNFYVNIPGWDTWLHTLNGFLCAAIGFSMIDLLNRHSKDFHLSPFYLAMVAFCFSMTVGVVWEFMECSADIFFGQDSQKDFIVKTFQSVTLGPVGSQIPIAVRNITDTVIHTASGKSYVIEGGYLDIGLLDTMKDLLVNFIGAFVYSIFGFFYVRQRNDHQKLSRTSRFARRLMIRVRGDEEKPESPKSGTEEKPDMEKQENKDESTDGK